MSARRLPRLRALLTAEARRARLASAERARRTLQAEAIGAYRLAYPASRVVGVTAGDLNAPSCRRRTCLVCDSSHTEKGGKCGRSDHMHEWVAAHERHSPAELRASIRRSRRAAAQRALWRAVRGELVRHTERVAALGLTDPDQSIIGVLRRVGRLARVILEHEGTVRVGGPTGRAEARWVEIEQVAAPVGAA